MLSGYCTGSLQMKAEGPYKICKKYTLPRHQKGQFTAPTTHKGTQRTVGPNLVAWQHSTLVLAVSQLFFVLFGQRNCVREFSLVNLFATGKYAFARKIQGYFQHTRGQTTNRHLLSWTWCLPLWHSECLLQNAFWCTQEIHVSPRWTGDLPDHSSSERDSIPIKPMQTMQMCLRSVQTIWSMFSLICLMPLRVKQLFQIRPPRSRQFKRNHLWPA